MKGDVQKDSLPVETNRISHVQVPLPSLGARQTKVEEGLQVLKREVSSTQHDPTEAEKQIESVIRAYHDEKEKLQQQVWQDQGRANLLEERITTLESELQACKDDLFRLQPLSQIPDSDIVRKYDLLIAQVSSWVEGEVDLYSEIYENSQIVYRKKIAGTAEYLNKYPDSFGEHLVQSTVATLLQQRLLNQDILLFGIPEGHIPLLRKVIVEMQGLDPPRGECPPTVAILSEI